MNKAYIYGLKLLTNLTFVATNSFLFVFDTCSFTIASLGLLINIITIAHHLLNKPKRHKTFNKKTHFIYIFLEKIFFLTYYVQMYNEYDKLKLKNKTTKYMCTMSLHILLMIVINYFILNDEIIIKAKRKFVRSENIRIGRLDVDVEKDGKIVLRCNEKIQILERYEGMMVVRKDNGEEYNISNAIVTVQE